MEHLSANRLGINKKLLALGPMLTLDTDKERFTGPMSNKANELISRKYRKPFVVSENI
jgi:hypothetical protein